MRRRKWGKWKSHPGLNSFNPQGVEAGFNSLILVEVKLPGQDSNLDEESQNPNTPRHNINPDSTLRPTTPAGCSAGCSDQQGEGGVPDADLARVLDAWPTLPEAIRRAVLALVGAASTPPGC